MVFCWTGSLEQNPVVLAHVILTFEPHHKNLSSSHAIRVVFCYCIYKMYVKIISATCKVIMTP